jgi:hypothetical protein
VNVDRERVLAWMASLMYAENFSDVHDVLNLMGQAVGVELEGDYLQGWTDADRRAVGVG